MTQRLMRLIGDWEIRSGFSVSTLKNAKEGKPIKRNTAYQIAKALGCTNEEAKGYADEASSDTDEPTAKETA